MKNLVSSLKELRLEMKLTYQVYMYSNSQTHEKFIQFKGIKTRNEINIPGIHVQ